MRSQRLNFRSSAARSQAFGFAARAVGLVCCSSFLVVIVAGAATARPPIATILLVLGLVACVVWFVRDIRDEWQALQLVTRLSVRDDAMFINGIGWVQWKLIERVCLVDSDMVVDSRGESYLFMTAMIGGGDGLRRSVAERVAAAGGVVVG